MTDRGPDGSMTDRGPHPSAHARGRTAPGRPRVAPETPPVSERTQRAAERIVARYPQPRSALLPLFYLVQAEHGRITPEGLAWCAEMVGVTRAEAQAVETYYEMYEHEDPGDWLITVCRNFSCKVRGSHAILRRLRELLGGDRDRDGKVAVKPMECLGNCEGAPVMQVNYNNYENMTVQLAEELLAACRFGDPPPAADGDVPPTFREVSWRLSGADDADRLHEAAVRAVRADMEDFAEPPAQRILDADKPLGSPGVSPPGADVGETGDIEPELTPDEARQARLEAEQIPTSDEQPLSDDAADPDHPHEDEDEDEDDGGDGDEAGGADADDDDGHAATDGGDDRDVDGVAGSRERDGGTPSTGDAAGEGPRRDEDRGSRPGGADGWRDGEGR